MVRIIDKTKDTTIDRNLILERIAKLKRKQHLPYTKPKQEPEEETKQEPKQEPEEEIREPLEKPSKFRIKPPQKKVVIKTPQEKEPQEPAEKALPPPKKPRLKIVSKVPLHEAFLEDKLIEDRLPKSEKIVQRVSNYYMNNRKISIEKLTKLFEPERQEFNAKKETVSCDASENIDLMAHQKIAREYLNLYTPYRGLLLYFSLGSGKSCTSIAIAEGMKTDKRIFVMTPASLKMNFFTELKKCGDPLFKKNQYWEFVSVIGHPEYVDILSSALSLPKDTIEKNKGAWLVDIRQPANFSELDGSQQKQIDDQLNEMIRSKYTDLNYNGLNMRKLRELTDDFTKNPFDHSVVVIDEAHNFVSRIVNKIKKENSISYKMYHLLMDATDCRIVLLSGTPIINYPNEIGILYNILRGFIKTWVFQLNVKTSQKINKDTILEFFDKAGFRTYDYVEYSGNKLTITRNPYGFINTKTTDKPPILRAKTYKKRVEKKGGKGSRRKTRKIIPLNTQPLEQLSEHEQEMSDELTRELDHRVQGTNISGITGGGEVFDKYAGVRLDETGNVSDDDFVRIISEILAKNGIDIIDKDNAKKPILNRALPDDSDEFMNIFIDQDDMALKNKRLLQRRILGLTSYYRSAQEQLLPRFIETDDNPPSVFHLEETEMSDYQFKIYSEIRKLERDQERKNKTNAKKQKGKKGVEDLYKISSTYRIFSRASCNFVFPTPPGRPMPTKKADEVLTEAQYDATPAKLLQEVDVYADNEDIEKSAEQEETSYPEKIQTALKFLKEHADEYLTPTALTTYSPKFKRILENLKDPANMGLHLIYSQFRTIEGIGILKLILEANGFEQLVVYKSETTSEWVLQEPKDSKKPRFILYTGTETQEEREILRNIYNTQWEFLPPSMAEQLREISENNYMGEIVKIMMITASGAEGINLRNTRFVHIVEPYWHMVRLEQVVGRARRICSHQNLPEELRTVKVFLYLSVFTEEQTTGDENKELIINDVSKLDKKTALTTDQALYETSQIKNTINQQILISIKESAIDCGIYGESSENLVCYGFGKIASNDFGTLPTYQEDEYQKDDLNIQTTKLKLRVTTINGKEYAYDHKTALVYDLKDYERAKKTGENLIAIGRVVSKNGRVDIVSL